jgi:hypothetical protein
MRVTTGDLWLKRKGPAAKSEGPVAWEKWKTQPESNEFSEVSLEQYIYKRVSIKHLHEPTQLAALAFQPMRTSAFIEDINLGSRGILLTRTGGHLRF